MLTEEVESTDCSTGLQAPEWILTARFKPATLAMKSANKLSCSLACEETSTERLDG
ncbi:MAG TPA: hypothetical protein VGV59_03925 [Pyrinomonadaceae bacterium]|nr:hypothetical protein [Pyrinomonadaceae bacterium]